MPAIRRVELDSAGPLGAGTRYLASSGFGPLEFAFEEEIVEWQPPQRLAYQGVSPWGRFRTGWQIEPTPGGSRVAYRMDYWFPAGRLGRSVGGLLTTLVRPLMNRRTAARLKEVVERRAWQPADQVRDTI